jgi:hypothetical protein
VSRRKTPSFRLAFQRAESDPRYRFQDTRPGGTRHRVGACPFPDRRHRSRDRHLRGRPGRRDAVRPAGGIAGAARCSVQPDIAGGEFSVRHADLSRSRSMPRPARSRSSATRQSTMSAGRSTR